MRLLLTYLFITFAILTKGQEPISITDILLTATKSPDLAAHQERLGLWNISNFDLPVIDKLEFRTQTNNSDLREQEYRVRLSPTGQKERKAQRNWYESAKASVEQEEDRYLLEAVVQRYDLVLDWLDHARRLPLLERRQLIVQDRLNALQRLVRADAKYLQPLIEAEEDLHNLQRVIFNENAAQKGIHRKLGSIFFQTEIQDIDTSKLLIMNDLRLIYALSDTVNAGHPDLQRRYAAIDELKAEYELEEASNKQWLDFAEVRYRNDMDNPFKEEISIGVGIQIPFKNRNQADLSELQLDRLDALHSLRDTERALNADLIEIKEEITHVFAEYDFLVAQMQNSQTLFTRQQMLENGTTDPLLLLEIEENLIKRRLRLQDLEMQVYQLYIKLLERLGLLQRMPLTNYLESLPN